MKKIASITFSLALVLSAGSVAFAQSANDDPCLLYLKAARNHRPDRPGYRSAKSVGKPFAGSV